MPIDSPAFTQEEYQQLIRFLPTWPTRTRHPRIRRERELLQNYVMIMVNSGMRVGEARGLKWRDFDTYKNPAGEWVTLQVQGKTGKRLVVCQPGTKKSKINMQGNGAVHHAFWHIGILTKTGVENRISDF